MLIPGPNHAQVNTNPLAKSIAINLNTPNLPNQALSEWVEAYFQYEVTTRASSQTIQRNDLRIFLSFLIRETGSDDCTHWAPRVAQRFKANLQQEGIRPVNYTLTHVSPRINF